jgi:hypothetical protein
MQGLALQRRQLEQGLICGGGCGSRRPNAHNFGRHDSGEDAARQYGRARLWSCAGPDGSKLRLPGRYGTEYSLESWVQTWVRCVCVAAAMPAPSHGCICLRLPAGSHCHQRPPSPLPLHPEPPMNPLPGVPHSTLPACLGQAQQGRSTHEARADWCVCLWCGWDALTGKETSLRCLECRCTCFPCVLPAETGGAGGQTAGGAG